MTDLNATSSNPQAGNGAPRHALAATLSAPEPAPVAAVYFEDRKDQPSIFDLVNALDGVCSALDAEQINFNDHDQLERISMLSTAARVLARQLNQRWADKPLTKKQLGAAREAQIAWAKLNQQAGGAA